MSVGIDGGYVRAAHKKGCFEVIAGRSVVAFRRNKEDSVPPTKCFGFVQTYDDKPRRRLWELMKSQGLQENQQIVFMSDGGDDVNQVQESLALQDRRASLCQFSPIRPILLSMLVREKMKHKIAEGGLFLFLGKNRKRLKAICYDGTRLLLLSKRMERIFARVNALSWPKNPSGTIVKA